MNDKFAVRSFACLDWKRCKQIVVVGADCLWCLTGKKLDKFFAGILDDFFHVNGWNHRSRIAFIQIANVQVEDVVFEVHRLDNKFGLGNILAE